MNHDNINDPRHYAGLRTAFGIDIIDLIEEMDFGYHLGNVVKYLFRHEYKGNPIEDLKKARWYLDRHIENLEEDAEDLAAFEERSGDFEGAVDAYGRPIRFAPPVNIEGDALYVHTPPDRIAGDDAAGRKLKDEYYEFNRFEILGHCAHCDREIHLDDVYIKDANGFEPSVIFCSDACVSKLKAWQGRGE